jgi:hypothetical protein
MLTNSHLGNQTSSHLGNQTCSIKGRFITCHVILLVEVRLALPWISAPPAANKVNIGKKHDLTIAAKEGN